MWRAGDHTAARTLLRDAMSRARLSPEAMLAAGKLLRRTGRGAEPAGWTVQLLGQCTTSWLADALAAVACGKGEEVSIHDGGYDNVLQALTDTASAAGPRTVVLLPWHQRLLSKSDRSLAQRVEDEVKFWVHAWSLLRLDPDARLVQVGYDWVQPGAAGYHLSRQVDSDIRAVVDVNDALRQLLPEGSYFVSLPDVSGTSGRDTFYDPRRYHWTKQPFSETGLIDLAEHLFAGMRAVNFGPKKALVLDLDNTLWGGVVGETGPQEIALGEGPEGEAYREFQAHLKGLAQRGIALAVCSKNNLADAQEPFRVNPNMRLGLDDISCFVANWESKAENIRDIAAQLNLGLDSFVFFDDSKAEQELVRQLLPEVAVVNVPEDPADYIRALQRGLWFEACTITEEDRQRTAAYRAAQRRQLHRGSTGNLDEYLQSMNLRADIRPIVDADMPRIVQLLAKTNQFNLTTRRHGPAAIRELLADSRAVGITLRLSDCFADYGLVAVVIALPQPQYNQPALLVETFVMSCRVIGRTVEAYLLNFLAQRARELGFQILLGEYVVSPKNQIVSKLYERLGFCRLLGGNEGFAALYSLPLAEAPRIKSFVQAMR